MGYPLTDEQIQQLVAWYRKRLEARAELAIKIFEFSLDRSPTPPKPIDNADPAWSSATRQTRKRWARENPDEEPAAAATDTPKDLAIEALQERVAELESAIRWALGEEGEFRLRAPKEGAYWWRAELRARSAL